MAPAVVSVGVRPGQGEVGADRQGKGGRNQARLPAAIPGADHDGDREHYQAAFDDVGEQECRNQGKNNAEDGDAVSEDWGPSRSNVAVAKKGELRSHELNLIPGMGYRELREFMRFWAKRQRPGDFERAGNLYAGAGNRVPVGISWRYLRSFSFASFAV